MSTYQMCSAASGFGVVAPSESDGLPYRKTVENDDGKEVALEDDMPGAFG